MRCQTVRVPDKRGEHLLRADMQCTPLDYTALTSQFLTHQSELKSSNVTQKHLKTWISGTGRFKWAFVFKSRPRVSVVNGVISRRLNSASFFDDYFNWLHHLSVTADEEPIPVWELWKHNRYWGMRWVTATCRSRSDVLFSLFRWWKSTLAP